MPEEFDTDEILRNTTTDNKRFNTLKNKNEIKDLVIINQNTLLVKVQQTRSSDAETLGDTNITLAIFTTAQARLKLYSDFLQPLGHQVLYYDTGQNPLCLLSCECRQASVLIPFTHTHPQIPSSSTTTRTPTYPSSWASTSAKLHPNSARNTNGTTHGPWSSFLLGLNVTPFYKTTEIPPSKSKEYPLIDETVY